jgi:hypothetical protein
MTGPESTVAGRLAAFFVAGRAGGVAAEVRHEAKRLLLNQLKASVGAAGHPNIAGLVSATLPRQ